MADMSDSRVIEMFDGTKFPNKKSQYTDEQKKQLESYIETVKVKIRKGSTSGDIVDMDLKVHKKISGTVQEIFAEVAQNNTVYVIDTANCGAYYFRGMKHNGVESDTLSLHSSGLAIDVNSSVNTQSTKTRNDPDSATEMRTTDHPFVKAFISRGFDWGGLWGNYYDPMHFEFTSKGGSYTPHGSSDGSPLGNSTGNTVGGYSSAKAPYTEVKWEPPIQGGTIAMQDSISKTGKIGMILGVHIRQKNIYGRKTSTILKKPEVTSPTEDLDTSPNT